jgi:hypothetical protein
MKENERLRMSENRGVPRNIYGTRRDKTRGDWTKLHNRIIDIDIFVNCNWVDTRWQYTFTHKQYTEHHN